MTTQALLDQCWVTRKLFLGAVSLTKNTNINRYKYSRYRTRFDRYGVTGRNEIIFGVDMSSSTKIDYSKDGILILGRGSTQGLEHTLSAEKMYSINFTVTKNKFCLRFHYNRANIYLFVNGKFNEIHKFKAKDSEILATPLCLGNISKEWSVDNMKKSGLSGYVYDFSVDYDAADDILDIHNYLIKKNDIV